MNTPQENDHDLTSDILELFIKHLSNEGILTGINIREIRIRYDFKKLLRKGTCKSKAISVLSKSSCLPVRYIKEITSST